MYIDSKLQKQLKKIIDMNVIDSISFENILHRINNAEDILDLDYSLSEFARGFDTNLGYLFKVDIDGDFDDEVVRAKFNMSEIFKLVIKENKSS